MSARDLAISCALLLAGCSNGTVQLSVGGDCSGAIRSPNEDCAERCSLATNGPQSLTAITPAGCRFDGWSGLCSGAAGCDLRAGQSGTVTATFTREAWPLSVNVDAPQYGSVSAPGALCAQGCQLLIPMGTTIELVANEGPGVFVNWSGDCTTTSGRTCGVTGDRATAVVAHFARNPNGRLRVVLSGEGTVTSTPAGLTCPTLCDSGFANGSAVTLTAAAAPGWRFAGWNGSSTCGLGATCDITVNGDVTLQAQFIQQRLVSLTFSGDGSGSVVEDSTGRSCTSACAFEVDDGAQLSLTPRATEDSAFLGWLGCPPSTGGCALTANSDVTIDARFLRVVRSVSGLPPGGSLMAYRSDGMGTFIGGALYGGVSTSYTIGGFPVTVWAGSRDVFVARLDGTGNATWLTHSSNSSGTAWLTDLVPDEVGGAVAIGECGFGDFAVGPYTFQMPVGSNDVFVLKLDGDGGVARARVFGNSSSESAGRIWRRPDGRLLITLHIEGAVQFGAFNVDAGLGRRDDVIVELDSQLDVLQARAVGGTVTTVLAPLADGGTAMFSNFGGTVDFGCGPFVPSPPRNGSDEFLAGVAWLDGNLRCTNAYYVTGGSQAGIQVEDIVAPVTDDSVVVHSRVRGTLSAFGTAIRGATARFGSTNAWDWWTANVTREGQLLWHQQATADGGPGAVFASLTPFTRIALNADTVCVAGRIYGDPVSGAPAFLETTQGAAVCQGRTDIAVMSLDAHTGAVRWKDCWGAASEEEGLFGLQPGPDGGFLLVGHGTAASRIAGQPVWPAAPVPGQPADFGVWFTPP